MRRPTRGACASGSSSTRGFRPGFSSWTGKGRVTRAVGCGCHAPGTAGHEPPGTCYYRAAESKWYYWNMFDQVLLRPGLLPYFKNQDLKILTTDGANSFLNKRGLPDRSRASDHLPIFFRLHV